MFAIYMLDSWFKDNHNTFKNENIQGQRDCTPSGRKTENIFNFRGKQGIPSTKVKIYYLWKSLIWPKITRNKLNLNIIFLICWGHKI